MARARTLDMVVVGAGFAGLYMVHRARGLGLDVQGIEAADGVGGTWWWNRYPGARCDVESLEYSFSFDDDLQQEWEWTERYATQPEILRYLEHVADRFDLRRSFRFGTRVTAAEWSDATQRWTVTTDAGDAYEARFVVMATGCLSVPIEPDLPGLDSFEGRTLYTSRWPHEEPDLTGARVGVVGTGSSAVQSIPLIAERAAAVTVFQRTPSYAVPAHNRPLDPEEQAAIKARYAELRAANREMSIGAGSRVPRVDASALEVDEQVRQQRYEEAWEWGGLPFLGAFNDLLLDPAANETAAEFVRAKIREQVADPEVAERLTPRQVIGCKRLCVDSGYYATFDQPHVRLVDVGATPIEEITPSGVRVDGEEIELDVLVLATGFDAMTGALDRIDVRGRDGARLRDAWAEGPRTYLGLAVHGFPNLFTVTGPGSPSVLTNMVVSIEHHVDWIADAVAHLDATGCRTIEAEAHAQDEWVTYVNDVASFTLFPTCGSWYLGANVPGKPRVFMPLPGFPGYAQQVEDITRSGYRGFALA
ncbi:NAD(P)/FAD-dependent oxidoreductase [Iamia sp. SCSIO 61187]|uniref:flavin-containing monooxygenase n=1 Tax=Iamia sp. SCSIO 61187 TaxID=2722752 RepID=UPI001C63B058|nr:NAD(P)/FAD-dependent oxidoreductase [Iamia sp. SCSIO 61187]QYG91945.1 NAD(P)/FAD-dependent oxidoreductase [Iamia sp. SCSIO 61187]